ncbi:MAG: class IV adenylate cyclase [Acidobacteria bacterium]|nr:class IV adenylate cyclase [Acidobacteriota bacterium]
MTKPAKNIEIKAKIHNLIKLQHTVEALSDTQAELLEQEDIFFPAKNGRLKLRIFNSSYGELIHYERPNSTQAKESSYVISKTNDPISLKIALSNALGTIGVVKKKRLLYITGQTRIHLDDVVGLGNFLELEYVLKAEEKINTANEIVLDLMRYLEVNNEDLIDCAYIDLLNVL